MQFKEAALAAAAAAFHGSPSPLSPSLSVQARQRAMMGGRQDVENTACLVVVADANSRGPFHFLGRKHDGDKEEEDKLAISWHVCHR